MPTYGCGFINSPLPLETPLLQTFRPAFPAHPPLARIGSTVLSRQQPPPLPLPLPFPSRNLCDKKSINPTVVLEEAESETNTNTKDVVVVRIQTPDDDAFPTFESSTPTTGRGITSFSRGSIPSSSSDAFTPATSMSTPLHHVSADFAPSPAWIDRLPPSLIPPPPSSNLPQPSSNTGTGPTTLTVSFLTLGMIFSLASHHRPSRPLRNLITIHPDPQEPGATSSVYWVEFAGRRIQGVKLVMVREDLPFTNAKPCGYGCRSTSKFITKGYANGIE